MATVFDLFEAEANLREAAIKYADAERAIPSAEASKKRDAARKVLRQAAIDFSDIADALDT